MAITASIRSLVKVGDSILNQILKRWNDSLFLHSVQETLWPWWHKIQMLVFRTSAIDNVSASENDNCNDKLAGGFCLRSCIWLALTFLIAALYLSRFSWFLVSSNFSKNPVFKKKNVGRISCVMLPKLWCSHSPFWEAGVPRWSEHIKNEKEMEDQVICFKDSFLRSYCSNFSRAYLCLEGMLRKSKLCFALSRMTLCFWLTGKRQRH